MLTDNEETRNALWAVWREPLTVQGAWSRVIAKANDLAGDTLRVVRCPEVEVVGEIADPLQLYPKLSRDALCFVAIKDGNPHIWFAHNVADAHGREHVTRWCLASDLARDPKTATWHERTTQRVRRWTPETVPEPGTAFAWYACDDGWNVCAAKHHDRNDRAALAEKWNERDDDPILAWLPLPTLAPDAERAE